MAQTEVTLTALTYNGRTIGTAVTTVQRRGQVDPESGDQVEVQVELELPAASADAVRTLHPELQFGSRVQLFEAPLSSNWSSVAGKVARTASYTGTLYADLVATASAYASTELDKLIAALADRQAALDAAG